MFEKNSNELLLDKTAEVNTAMGLDRNIWHKFENWLIPQRCVLTDRSIPKHQIGMAMDLSQTAVQSFRPLQQVCRICAEPCLLTDVCGRCLNTPPAYQRTQAAFCLNDALHQLIYDFKYHEQIAYARIFAEIMAQRIDSSGVQAILAVPAHPKRRRQRGYNQAYELSKQLAKQMDLVLLDQAVMRIEDTPSQTLLSKQQRQQNLRSAFALDIDKLTQWQSVAIVDDVITTGATVNAVAKLIKKSLPELKIEAWALAKTL